MPKRQRAEGVKYLFDLQGDSLQNVARFLTMTTRVCTSSLPLKSLVSTRDDITTFPKLNCMCIGVGPLCTPEVAQDFVRRMIRRAPNVRHAAFNMMPIPLDSMCDLVKACDEVTIRSPLGYIGWRKCTTAASVADTTAMSELICTSIRSCVTGELVSNEFSVYWDFTHTTTQ